MKMKFLHTVVFFCLCNVLISQTKANYRDYFLEGSYLILENNFDQALKNFEIAYKLDSSSANINYLLGICYLQSPLKKAKSERYLAKAVKNISSHYRTDEADEKAAAPIAEFYYGQALHINYKFDEAIAQYEAFRKFVAPKDKEFQQMVDKEIATSKLAKEMVAHPINVQITNMGDSINSEFPDFSPVLSADERTMIFTTRRPNSTGERRDEDGQYYEDIVISYKDDNDIWSKPVSLSNNVNSMSHEASINLTPDGQTLIVYKTDPSEKNPEGDGNIYYTTFDGKDWSALKDFGSNVNTIYWETHACLSADGNVLFFVSDRPGGFGGKDIYRCIKLPNGKWSKALNMGKTINTENDEDGAFIHPDGQTFFFSSNGHKSMGGYDIMYATLDEDNKFTNVQNIGYPINTTDDDVFYVTSPDGKRSYFSSAKTTGFGEKDIYKITIAEPKETFLALFRGQLIPAEGEKLPENITILVTDKMSNEIVGTYRPKIVNGTFTTILPPGKEYNFSYQTDDGEEFYNEDVYVSNEMTYQEIRREVNLEPVKFGGKLKVKQKAITLNVVVLTSSRGKRPVPGAKITMEEVGGAAQFFDAKEGGKYEGIILQPEKRYNISATFEGKKSEVAEITTVGAKTSKIINQVIYLDGRAEKFTSKELLLDVLVKSSKTKKPIPNVSIILTDLDGEKVEVMTNSKGVIKGIELSPESKYELVANKDGSVSEKEVFTTGPIAEGKRFSKTLYISWEGSAIDGQPIAEGATLPPSEYEFYYKYNHNVIDETEPNWLNFIDNIVALSKRKKYVSISIKSSASRVPRRGKGGNKALAETRAKKLEAKIKQALKAKGVKTSKIRFKHTSIVGGPKYKGDWNLGRKKYEKHQYSKAKAR